MQIQKRMCVYNKFLLRISLWGISSLTCCNAVHTHDVRCIWYHSNCSEKVWRHRHPKRMWARAREKKKPTTMIFPFPVCIYFFFIVICMLHPFFSTLFSWLKKPQMNWCGEIEDLCFLLHFQIIFYCFCNVFYSPLFYINCILPLV